jgi:hypothetical protein
MSELYQPGQHPDADQLSAFAEDALPAHERAQTLAHLAGCSDCRMIVSLALPPVEDIPQLQPAPARRPWFYTWSVAWLAGAGLAALIFLTIHIRNGSVANPPTQTADAHLPAAVSDPQPQASPLKAAAPPPAKTPAPAAAPIFTDAARAPLSGAAIDSQSINNLPVQNRRYIAQPQQQQMQQQTARNNYLNNSISGGAAGSGAGIFLDQRNNSTATSRGAASANASGQPLTAAAAAAAAPPVTASDRLQSLPAAPPAPARVMAAPRSNTTVEVSAAAPEIETTNATLSTTNGYIASAKVHALPNHLGIASTIARGNQMLALDTAGALFLSNDAGRHWKAVATKWAGRAVKVELASFRPQPSGSLAQLSMDADSNASSTIIRGRDLESLTASISGTITDPTGATIPGASIAIIDTRTAISRTVKSDRAGHYSVSGLAPDPYQIDATQPGFEAQRTTVTLVAAQPNVTNFALIIGAASETVTVASEVTTVATKNKKTPKAAKVSPVSTPPVVFEIITDTGELWTSADGQTWKRK